MATGANVIWQTPIGGRTTPIVQKGHIYLINKVGENITQQERVLALDEKTGKVLWEHKFNVFHSDIVADRLGWTTMVGDPETDTVFAHGTQGLLQCFDRNGKILWQHSLTEEYGRITGYGGRVTSPIIDGDLLLMSMANASWGDQATGRTRFVAFDKRTGKVVWWASTGFPIKDTYYSTPVVADVAGQRLIIGGGGDGGVHAFKVRTGEKVWSYIFGTADVNCSPVVSGNLVFIGHGENNDDASEQGRVICLDASKVEGRQAETGLEGGRHQGEVRVADLRRRPALRLSRAILPPLPRRQGRQGTLEVPRRQEPQGLAGPGRRQDLHRRGRRQVPHPQAGRQEVHPAARRVVPWRGDQRQPGGGQRPRILHDDGSDLLHRPEGTGEADRDPGTGQGSAARGPCGRHSCPGLPGRRGRLRPGESVELKALGYDAGGHLIGEVKVDWSLAGSKLPEGLPPPAPGTPGPPVLLGSLSEMTGSNSTKLTIAPPPPPGQFGRVLATLPGTKIVGEARVRVVPKLPYKADFSKIPEGRTPGGWVNTQGKYAVAKLADGTFALKKLAVNPNALLNRANAYIGTPDMKDYTVEVEMMGTKVGDDLPDSGIVVNRYTFMLAGNRKVLRLVDWDALPRIDKNLPMGTSRTSGIA